ncbi:MAG: MFS transporter [Corynebacteriales bacterium]|nr:MFS transporter [Mycobacteriales bacterium]
MTQTDAEPSVLAPPAARGLLLAMGVNAFGYGTTIPFILLYLNTHQHISFGVVTLAVSCAGIAALLVAPVAGSAIDHFGARGVYIAAALAKIGGPALLIVMQHPWHAFVALAINAAGDGTARSALSTMLTQVSAPSIRQRVFSLQFMLFNAGVGFGGLIGGLLVDTGRQSSFTALFLIDALGFLIGAAIIAFVKLRPHAEEEDQDEDTQEPSGGLLTHWRSVLADPAMRWVCCCVFLIGALGYAQLNNGIPLFALNIAEVSPRTLGIAFAAATAVIVLSQLGTMRLLEGHRRTRAMACFGVFSALAFAFLGASGLVPGGAVAATLVVATTSIFALGETLWWPTTNAIISEIAPKHLRGRYISLSTMTFSGAMATGPLLVGVMFDAGLTWAYIAIVVLGGCAIFWSAHKIRAHISSVQDGLKPLPLNFVPTPVWAKASTQESAPPTVPTPSEQPAKPVEESRSLSEILARDAVPGTHVEPSRHRLNMRQIRRKARVRVGAGRR